MGNYNSKNIDFVRQTLVKKMARPLSVIALYPQNSSDTKLFVQVVSNATVIALRYISSTTVNKSITFTGKSLKEVVQEINQSGLPIKAVQLTEIDSLSQGDILSTGTGYVEIPYGFTTYERLTDRGVVLRAKKIAVRHKNSSSIYLLPPYLEDPSLPWYPRISNGAFSQKYNGRLYHFYIKEYDQQSWSSVYGKPFKDLKGISPTAVDTNVYSLPRTPVFWNGENIIVYNGDIPVSQNVIEDIDVNNGLLYTKPNFYLQEDFTLDYTYLESSFVYKEIDINGHFCRNPFIIDKYVLIYMLPAESAVGSNKKTVFHSIGNSIEEAINSIQIEDPSIPIAIIGAYNIQQLFSNDRVSILDTRVKGGGLIENKGPKSTVHNIESPLEPTESSIESFYPEAYRFWDIGNVDGEHYPSAAAVIMEIPESIKEVLSVSEIKSKATKYLAAGVYPSISFYKEELPAVTGLAAQVSCAYNLDFSDTYTKLTGNYPLLTTVPTNYYGAGWFLNTLDIPTSIFSGSWNSYSGGPSVIESEGKQILTVGTATGVFMSYIKSTPIVGIEWKERSVIETSGDYTQFSPWTTKRYIDDTDVATGHLIKNRLTFGDEHIVKQYKDVVIHSPYITGNVTELVKDSIEDITSRIFERQVNSVHLSEGYSSVDDVTDTYDIGNYLLVPSEYNKLFSLLPVGINTSKINDIGKAVLQSGIYTSGHYFKIYLQSLNSYSTFTGGDPNYLVLSFNNQIEALSNYLNYRSSTWSGDCNTGLQSLTGLVNALVSSANYYGAFETAIPTTWAYLLQSGVVYPFSGQVIDSAADLGGTITEISTDYNYDYLYTDSLAPIFSTLVAHTGAIEDSTTRSIYNTAYSLAKTNIVDKAHLIINGTRTYSGLQIPTNWFLGHNRLGTFLGLNAFNICNAYDYLSTQLVKSSPEYNTGSYQYANSSFLNHMFSGIETILTEGYDAVYQNLLRGGIVEPNIAYAIYSYGWYLNNWEKNYGLYQSLYQSDKREKFELLFSNGLKQLIKNCFNSDNQLIETTTVNGETGPFYSSTPYKLLYPLEQAIKYSDEWLGIAEGVVKMITETYGVSGLYYSDPFKNSNSAGAEINMLPALARVYSALTASGQPSLWEPLSTGLEHLRGADFVPYGHTDLFVDYNTGVVESCVAELKSIGINTIRPQLNYSYWKASGASFLDKLSHLADTCVENRMRMLPVIVSEPFSGLSNTGFMQGSFSGQRYVSEILTSIGTSSSVVGWNIVSNPSPLPVNLINYNSIAYILQSGSNRPVYATVPFNELVTNLTGAVYSGDTYNLYLPQNNPRYEGLFIKVPSTFEYLLNLIPNYSKNVILASYGDAKYGDYSVAIDRAIEYALPISLSNLYVNGESGVLYNDGEARNIRNINSIIQLANSHEIEPTGAIVQKSDFTNVDFFSGYYPPSYSGQNIISALSSWSYSDLIPSNSGEFRFRIEQLSEVQRALDHINHRYISGSYYTLPNILTDLEATQLNYFRSEWNAVNLLVNTGNAWYVSGEIDYTRYNQFVYDWGTSLKNIVNRIGFNG